MRFSFVVALLLGGWGGALVAAACPHAGAQSHACCPRIAKAEPPHCHEDGGAQPTEASHDEQHAASHASHVAGQHADANHLEVVRSTFASAQPAGLCSHCLSRPAPARLSAETREPGRARDETGSPAPRAQVHRIFYNVSLKRAVVTLEHAPPLATRRHILLGLFLI